jgi:molybdate transport system substrate-binding protein
VKSRAAAGFAVLLLILAACSSSGASSSPSAPPSATSGSAASSVAPASPSAASTDLTILAAASLKDALAAVKTAYATAVPGVTLTISTDASSAIEMQIEQGAPADVFLSADTTNPKKLVDKGLTAGPAVDFADNKLVVIVPTDNPARIRSPADLAKPGCKVIAAGDAVPITKYADQLVDNLAKVPGYPANYANAYQANIASKEDNVKAVVAKLELGEGDAAIVYVTDAKASTKVGSVAIVPESADVLATYAGVVVKSTTQPDAANAFLMWLAGPDGQAILRGFGFLPPS